MTNSPVPSWTEQIEQDQLALLAKEVPAGGTIVEIGCLYGGTTAVMALANPEALITSIDEFSWTPEGCPPATPERFLANMKDIGASNVSVIVMDSRDAAKTWTKPIDFLFIDGGHSYEFVYADLCNFAPLARKVALHDYNNPFWATIKKAVDDFIFTNPVWEVETVTGTVAVLVRKPAPKKVSKKA